MGNCQDIETYGADKNAAVMTSVQVREFRDIDAIIRFHLWSLR